MVGSTLLLTRRQLDCQTGPWSDKSQWHWLVSLFVFLYLCHFEVLFCDVQLKPVDFFSTLRYL
ncbi:rCG63374 [Rattus norvegicus]|uniref:RCG63374 n=1 Tax=Rattus norvegicus TaxID=10116 RepID=A6K6Z3_RAT|nr:rCG63374 [Rattus norvegicus]